MERAENRRRPERGARGGRAGNRGRGGLAQRPWKLLERPYPPTEILSADQVESLHRAALELLAEIGMKVLDGTARQRFRSGGAAVDEGSQMVRFEPALLEELVAKAPATFTLSARNPARDLTVGGRHSIFVAVGGPAYVSDLEKGRRAGSFAEMCDFLKAIQGLESIHQEGGGPFEPLDLDPETRHLDFYLAAATLLDKSWQGIGLGRARTLDSLEMAARMLGLADREALIGRPTVMTVINTNSPLVLDEPMAEGLIALAEHGQPAIITPFTLAGAMAPVTLAGALVQQHAEALAAVALTQIVRPGCPVVYGAFTSNVDMKSGSPAFGTPEYAQAAQISGQLARRVGLPFRSSNVNAANAPDAQSAWESQMALWGALMGGANVVEHAAGWLGGGLVASAEKLVIDAEMLQMMAAYFEPPAVDAAALALDAQREVGPGGHFFGCAHTLERYETAFHTPLVANWDNHDAWVERGSPTAPEKAHEVWKQLLADYQRPPIDPAAEEAMGDYVARRKREMGKG